MPGNCLLSTKFLGQERLPSGSTVPSLLESFLALALTETFCRRISDSAGGKNVPQRLKPGIAVPFTARLKPCPSRTAFARTLFRRREVSLGQRSGQPFHNRVEVFGLSPDGVFCKRISDSAGGKNVPQRLKPGIAVPFTARLKPCPSKDCIRTQTL